MEMKWIPTMERICWCGVGCAGDHFASSLSLKSKPNHHKSKNYMDLQEGSQVVVMYLWAMIGAKSRQTDTVWKGQ